MVDQNKQNNMTKDTRCTTNNIVHPSLQPAADPSISKSMASSHTEESQKVLDSTLRLFFGLRT